jgi:hypothetical protein
MDRILSEHLSALDKGYITLMQYNIITARVQAPVGATYLYLQTKYKISRPEKLKNCLLRTALMEKWELKNTGGARRYLSPYDTYRFLEDVKRRAMEADCITVHDALELALSLKRERIAKARGLLQAMTYDLLCSKLKKIESPNRDWILNTIKNHGIKVCTPQQLEIYRRQFCTFSSISRFYLLYEMVFQRDSRLIFNMDETQLNSSRKFKVLVPKGQLPLIVCDEKIPHITAAITIGANGAVFKPLIVFKHMKHKNSLAEFESYFNIASSRNGWMTKTLFRYYAILFVAELSHYRLTLPDGLHEEPVLLIVDGHKSRYDFLALLILFAFNVDVIILPPHSTHITQPFDVSIANPLKTFFKKELLARLPELLELDPSCRQKSSTLRKIVLISFSRALSKATNISNVLSGFEKAGIAPYNTLRPLSSQYVFEENQLEINSIEDKNKRTDDMERMGTRMLTSEKALNYLCHFEKGRDLDNNDFELNLISIVEELYNGSIEDGRALSHVDSLLIEETDVVIRRLNFPAPSDNSKKTKLLMKAQYKGMQKQKSGKYNKASCKQKMLYQHKIGEVAGEAASDLVQCPLELTSRGKERSGRIRPPKRHTNPPITFPTCLNNFFVSQSPWIRNDLLGKTSD